MPWNRRPRSCGASTRVRALTRCVCSILPSIQYAFHSARLHPTPSAAMRNAPFEHDCRSLSLLSLSSRKPCAGTVAELQATIASLQAERAGSAATLLAHGEEAAKALAASTQLAARAALAQLAAREEAAERARRRDG